MGRHPPYPPLRSLLFDQDIVLSLGASPKISRAEGGGSPGACSPDVVWNSVLNLYVSQVRNSGPVGCDATHLVELVQAAASSVRSGGGGDGDGGSGSSESDSSASSATSSVDEDDYASLSDASCDQPSLSNSICFRSRGVQDVPREVRKCPWGDGTPFFLSRIFRNGTCIGWGATCKLHCLARGKLVKTCCKKTISFGGGRGCPESLTDRACILFLKRWLIAGLAIHNCLPCCRMLHMSIDPRSLDGIAESNLDAELGRAWQGWKSQQSGASSLGV